MYVLSSQIYRVGESAHLSTWIATEAKHRFATAAARQGLSESALLRRLVENLLSVGNEEPGEPARRLGARDTRVTVRLVPEDRAMLQDRAAARSMAAATYMSFLARAHLRHLAPLPERELAALRGAVNELSAVGRNLNAMVRLAHQGEPRTAPGAAEIHTMLQVCSALRDHFRALIRANLISWEVGRADRGP